MNYLNSDFALAGQRWDSDLLNISAHNGPSALANVFQWFNINHIIKLCSISTRTSLDLLNPIHLIMVHLSWISTLKVDFY